MISKKILRPWVVQARALGKYLRRKFQPQTHPPVGRQPAFDPETEKWFQDRIGSVKSYLEYGAGASTLLIADARIPAISVESDADYADAVRAVIPNNNQSRIVAVNIGRTQDWGYPLWMFKTTGAVQKWKAYPKAGPAELDETVPFPDLVLIDGRFRVACCLSMVKASIVRKQPTQILFDDYALRPHYAVVEQVIGKPQAIGRAALFQIEPGAVSLETTLELLETAYSDFR